mmetsp:Transcript_130/g.415  ORF Transcript_130/g.415 Transcript_130/m.415 type:complete len:208 (-) Transcript_130:619-1242(-)
MAPITSVATSCNTDNADCVSITLLTVSDSSATSFSTSFSSFSNCFPSFSCSLLFSLFFEEDDLIESKSTTVPVASAIKAASLSRISCSLFFSFAISFFLSLISSESPSNVASASISEPIVTFPKDFDISETSSMDFFKTSPCPSSSDSPKNMLFKSEVLVLPSVFELSFSNDSTASLTICIVFSDSVCAIDNSLSAFSTLWNLSAAS